MPRRDSIRPLDSSELPPAPEGDDRPHHPTLSEVRAKMRAAFEASGLTMEEVGLRMGYKKEAARKAVSRLLNIKVKHDPNTSTFMAFAKAIGKSPANLL